VPGKDISILSKILSILIDEIGSTKKIANLEAIQSEVKEEWPALADLQGIYVEKVLRHTRGNKTAAARLLNIDRKTLDRMIKRHQLSLSETRTLIPPLAQKVRRLPKKS